MPSDPNVPATTASAVVPPSVLRCATCAEYVDRRTAVLVREFVKHRNTTGEPIGAIVHRYLAGVHARHLAGLPILAVLA
jgi:hypothetical protein